jgi:hypothetical protein
MSSISGLQLAAEEQNWSERADRLQVESWGASGHIPINLGLFDHPHQLLRSAEIVQSAWLFR